MSATDRRIVQTQIFERFEAVFGNLRKDPEAKKILAREYFRIFQGCPDEVVSKVADRIIDEHDAAGWPKPAAIRRAIRFLEWVPRVGIEGVAELEPAPAPAGGAE